jgi:hypothetical protein
VQITGKSAAGAAAPFDLEFWFWILTFDPAQVGLNPLLTTETFG